MPSKSTVERAKRDLREGKRPSTAAGEFVHEEIEHVRRGKHGARSSRQAIAIGLSKARRAGVPLPPPKRGRAKSKTRASAVRDYEVGAGQAQSPCTLAQAKPRHRRSLEARRSRRGIAVRPVSSREARRGLAAAPARLSRIGELSELHVIASGRSAAVVASAIDHCTVRRTGGGLRRRHHRSGSAGLLRRLL